MENTKRLKIPDTCISGITFIFIPNKEPKYRTVRSNTGHLATLFVTNLHSCIVTYSNRIVTSFSNLFKKKNLLAFKEATLSIMLPQFKKLIYQIVCNWHN